MINNNQKLQQMAMHKQNNYTSPEVTVVDFKVEMGVGDSTMNVGNASLEKLGTQTFTHDNSTDNWSSVIPSSTPISGN